MEKVSLQQIEEKQVYKLVYEQYYEELSKISKRYIKKLKKKMIRSNREPAYIYEKLANEAKLYYEQEINDEKIEFPNIKVRSEELLNNLPILNLKRELKNQLQNMLWISTFALLLKSGYHLFTGTTYTIALSDIITMILIYLNGLIGIGGTNFLRISIFSSLFIFVIFRDGAKMIHLCTVSATTGFIIASIFLVITLFFRKK